MIYLLAFCWIICLVGAIVSYYRPLPVEDGHKFMIYVNRLVAFLIYPAIFIGLIAAKLF